MVLGNVLMLILSVLIVDFLVGTGDDEVGFLQYLFFHSDPMINSIFSDNIFFLHAFVEQSFQL